MKMRLILAAAVLGLGVVTMTSAQQQTVGQPAQRAGEKSKLRAELAKLRAELELREIEHEADRSLLLEAVKEVKQVDSASAQSALLDLGVNQRIGALAMSGGDDGLAELTKLQTPEGQKSLRTEIEKKVKDVVKSTVGEIDLRKKEFVKKTTELNIKRLELAEVETRYSEAK